MFKTDPVVGSVVNYRTSGIVGCGYGMLKCDINDSILVLL